MMLIGLSSGGEEFFPSVSKRRELMSLEWINTQPCWMQDKDDNEYYPETSKVDRII